MEEEEGKEEDQRGKGETAACRPGTAGGTGGTESNRAELGFRSDRAAKTNRRTLCGRFVVMATITDARSPVDRTIDRVVSIAMLRPPIIKASCKLRFLVFRSTELRRILTLHTHPSLSIREQSSLTYKENFLS